MQFIRLLDKINKQKKRIEELEDIIVENQRNTIMLIAQHVKMLEWIAKTDKEIDKLRKDSDKNVNQRG